VVVVAVVVAVVPVAAVAVVVVAAAMTAMPVTLGRRRGDEGRERGGGRGGRPRTAVGPALLPAPATAAALGPALDWRSRAGCG
jgi:hypothetical protein